MSGLGNNNSKMEQRTEDTENMNCLDISDQMHDGSSVEEFEKSLSESEKERQLLNPEKI